MALEKPRDDKKSIIFHIKDTKEPLSKKLHSRKKYEAAIPQSFLRQDKQSFVLAAIAAQE